MKYSDTESDNVKTQANDQSDDQSRKGGSPITKIFILVLSFLAALAVWMFVTRPWSVTVEKSFYGVEVTVRSSGEKIRVGGLIGKDLLLESVSDTKVDVKIVGKKSAMKNIDEKNIEAYIDISDVSEPKEDSYKIEFAINGVNVNETSDFESAFSDITKVGVRIVKSVSKVFKVEKEDISFEGWSISSDCEILKDQSSVNIDYVEVRGNSTDIDLIRQIKVKTNSSGLISTDVSSMAYIEAYDENGKAIGSSVAFTAYSGGTLLENGTLTEDKRTVDDIVVSIKLLKTKELVLTLNTEYGYISDVTIEPSSVIVRGVPSVVDSMNEILIGYVNEKNEGSGERFEKTYSDIHLPDGIYRIIVDGNEKEGNVIESVKVSALIDVTFSSKIYPVGIENISFESWTIPSDCEFYKENSDVNIDFVEISGISTEIEKIKSVRMKTNAIGMISGDVTSSVSIEALDESGKNAGASLEYKAFAGGELKNGILTGAEEVKSDITVNIRLIKTKEVPIVFVGEYGFFMDITVSPSSVFIKGTPSLVDSTDKLSLEKVNEKEIASEVNEFSKVFKNIDFSMDGLYEICDKDGKVYENSVIPECSVRAKLCPCVEITIPSENVTVVGDENVTPGELKILVRASEGNESLIVILEDNLKKGKGGVSVLAEVSDKTSMKAKVTTIRFSSDFDGKIYEITGDGSYFVSYTK